MIAPNNTYLPYWTGHHSIGKVSLLLPSIDGFMQLNAPLLFTNYFEYGILKHE
jgi:hypothetical protein